MNSKTAKLISPERVEQLLECYGANSQAWPEDERSTALALIHHSSELQQLQKQAEQLDELLYSDVAQQAKQARADHKLVSAIVSNLPEQDPPANRESRPGNGQTTRSFFGSGNWLGMIAASVAVFVISVSIMELQPSPTPQTKVSLQQPELDVWMWEQVTGESDSDDEESLTMLSLLELEEL